MQFMRYVPALVMMSLLGACGDDAQQPGAGAVPAAAPASPGPDALAGADMPGPGDSLDGAALYARACASCHGETGEGIGDFPGLVALSRADVRARLQAYRAGETVGPRSALMAPVASQLSDAQIEALAAYLGG